MTCDVRLSRSAEKDIGDIVSYLTMSLHSAQAAGAFLDRLDETVERISRYPESFPLSLDSRLARMGYRKALLGRYVLLYRASEKNMVIAHVFHGSQDYARLV